MLLVKYQNLSKRKTNQIWIQIQITSPFCPFWLIQNPCGIRGWGKKQSLRLFIWINFGIQSFSSLHIKFGVIFKWFKCTPNSNFKMEAEFENVPWSKVVEFEKLSNFHFWRFSTSLENLWVIWKINAVQFCKYFKNRNPPERHLPACRRRHAAAAADRVSPLSHAVTRCRLYGDSFGSCRSQTRPSPL